MAIDKNTDAENIQYDITRKIVRETQMRNRLLAEGTEELISQANWTKRCAAEATRLYTEERAVGAAISNQRSLTKTLNVEWSKLFKLTTPGLEAELEAQTLIVSQLEKKVHRAGEAVKLSREALEISENMERSNRLSAHFSSVLTSGFEKLLSKVPGGSIFKDALQIDGVKRSLTDGFTEILSNMTKTGKGAVSLGRGFSQMGSVAAQSLSKIAAHPVALLILAVVAALTAAIKRFVELDKAAEEFRKTTGLITPQMSRISKMAREINVQMRHMGIGIEEAYKSAAALVEVFSVAVAVTKDTAQTIAALAANIGVAEGDAAKVYQTFLGLSGMSEKTATNALAITANLTAAAGVPINLIFKDIANASNETLIFLGRAPLALLRTAVEARRLGTTLESMTKSARGMLNFQESINAEMELSALTGRSINLQLSRQLAFEGKIESSRTEALRQLDKLGDFDKMSVYQKEAAAKAVGMEVGEIVKMQAQKKMLARLNASTDARDIAALAKYKKLQEELNDENRLSDAEKDRAFIMQQNRQAEITKLTSQLKSMWTDIGDALMPIAQIIMPIVLITVKSISLAVKFISGIIRGLLSPLDKALESFGGISGTMEKLMPMFDKAGEWASSFGELIGYITLPVAGILKLFGKTLPLVGSIGSWISRFALWMSDFGKIANVVAGKLFTIGGAVTKIGGVFAKWAGPIGLVIMAIQTLYKWVFDLIDIWRNVGSWADVPMALLKSIASFGTSALNALLSPIDMIMDWFGVKIPNGIVAGIVSVGSNVMAAIIQPFYDAWNWISDKFIGHSPSEIGKGIVLGIKSVVDTVFDLLTYPFRKAYDYLKKIPIIGKLFSAAGNIVSKITGDITEKVETQANTVVEIANLDILREAIDKLTEAISKLGSIATSSTTTTESDKTATKVQELIDLLRNGAIAVNLDGRKVSSALTNVGR